MRSKLDTRAIGLDVGLAFTKWLTGAENLHYGLWDGIEPTAGNLRKAQDAYTEKLFSFLPRGNLKILDIGGGAGETAGKLCALGHRVDIIVPSAYLASRCRENAPRARVHEMRFEDFREDQKFDLCLFSESYQYIPLEVGLTKCARLLSPEGHVLLADCFRSDAFDGSDHAVVGGGHRLADFERALPDTPFTHITQVDITDSVAPSVDLEQALFNVVGHAVSRIDNELAEKRPRLRWLIQRALRTLVSKRRRHRLDQRLNETLRNSEVFRRNNRYVISLSEASVGMRPYRKRRRIS